MQIKDMTIEECRQLLERSSLARLACEMDGQPYVVPIYLVCDGNYLFGFATMGYKIDCMRGNPLVCVEFDEINNISDWKSVVVFGTYEELPDTPEFDAQRAHAHRLLQKRARWWEPACVSVEHHEYPKTFSPIVYRIHINRMTGRAASEVPV
jgi:nitroimidazol reductase NimA-like FMN-containing flavoprotein (pyridoxamine 5'-phosphate oxidase superfamily)